MGRPPCCDKMNVKKGAWTAEEDAKLLAYTSTHGTGNWTSVPKRAGLKRCGKSCRLRWTNYLRPNLKHDNFTPEEEEMIINLHATIGSRWSIIANQLPGRTDNDVKNYWNTKLRKKLIQRGIDPVTHKVLVHVNQSIQSLSSVAATAAATVTSYPSPISPSFGSLINANNVVFAAPSVPGYSPNLAWNSNYISCNFSGPLMANETTSSSSSSTTLAADKILEWTEFLVKDAVIAPREEDPSNTLLERLENSEDKKLCESIDEDIGGDPFGDSSKASDFIDALLDQDREMQSEFLELLTGPDS